MKNIFLKINIKDLLLNSLYAIFAAGVIWLGFKLFSQAVNTEDDKLYQAEMLKNYAVYAPVLPDKLDFAGEAVPLENFDVRESLDKELLKTMYWQSETFLYLKRAERFFPVMRKILQKNNIPEDFLFLAVTESGLENVVSPAKATGYWQFLNATGKEFGLEINDEIDERYHIEKSTQAACTYFRRAYNKYKSWTLVAASYNMGQGGLDELMGWQKNSSYYDLLHNPETGRYVYRILAYKLLLTNPEKYGFVYRHKDLYPVIHTKQIEIDSSIKDLVVFAKNYSINYKIFKFLNPWLRAKSLSNPSKKTYKLTIPENGARDFIYFKDAIKSDSLNINDTVIK